MAQGRKINTTTRRNVGNAAQRYYRQDNNYIYGNAVRKFDVQRQLEEPPQKKLSNETRKNRDKAHHMSLGYVVFLMAAMFLSGYILLNYVQLQANITNKVEHISQLESKLNYLKLENDEEHSRITSSVDLEEIKRIAIGELGMTYAKEGQIETYTNEGNDYFRMVTDD